jgi:hypothetical protein
MSADADPREARRPTGGFSPAVLSMSCPERVYAVRNPTGYAGTMRAVQRMCREKSPEAVGTLFELLHSHDERVRLIAAQKILE